MVDANPTNEADDHGGRAIALCLKCLAELGPVTDFCPRCRAPVSSFAGTGPYESALAQGWAIGEAVTTKAPNLFTLIGLWFLCLPACAFGGFWFIASASDGSRWPESLGGLVVTAGAALYGYCLIRGTRNYLRRKRGRAPGEAPTSDISAR